MDLFYICAGVGLLFLNVCAGISLLLMTLRLVRGRTQDQKAGDNATKIHIGGLPLYTHESKRIVDGE